MISYRKRTPEGHQGRTPKKAWCGRSASPRADFDGQTVIVTGAASGIGRATASRVTSEGGRVIAVDISSDRLDDTLTSLSNTEVVMVAGDTTQQADIDRIVGTAGSRIDGLANVAGVNDDFSPAHETSDAIWDRVLGINLTGSFKLTRAVLPTMLAAGRGAIVNVSSEAGLRGNASGTAYTVSKHGIVGLTRSAAFMYGPQGIRVNAVAPGGVATGIPMPATISETGRGRLGPFLNLIPPVATAEHLAASITFLLSDDAVNINGAILPSDGGWVGSVAVSRLSARLPAPPEMLSSVYTRPALTARLQPALRSTRVEL